MEALIDVLEQDAEQRREWLSVSQAGKPEFMHKYTARSRAVFHERDKKVEAKIDTAEDDAELTSEAKEEIRSLRAEMQREIASQTSLVVQEFEKQFKVNPMFQGLTSEDHAHVCEANKRDCAGVERRIRADYTKKIERVRCALTSRTESSRYEKSAWNRMRRERRDREEIASCIELLAKEKKEIAEFEAGMQRRWESNKEMTEEDERKDREAHAKDLENAIRGHKADYIADRERKDRMGNARYIQLCHPEREETTEYYALIHVYRRDMQSAYDLDNSTLTWDRAVLCIDTAFTHACMSPSTPDKAWEEFIYNVVCYWTCLAMPNRRQKWNRIIRRYALLFLDHNLRTMRPVDVSHNAKMRELRAKRDDLLESILDMDQDIRAKIGRSRREKMKKEKTVKMPALEVDTDFRVRASEPEPKMANRGQRANVANCIGTNTDDNSEGETVIRSKRMDMTVGVTADHPVTDARATNVTVAAPTFSRKNRIVI